MRPEKGRRQGWEEEQGVLLIVWDIVTGISFLKREEEDVGPVMI